jgi:hypothetical protein
MEGQVGTSLLIKIPLWPEFALGLRVDTGVAVVVFDAWPDLRFVWRVNKYLLWAGVVILLSEAN